MLEDLSQLLAEYCTIVRAKKRVALISRTLLEERKRMFQLELEVEKEYTDIIEMQKYALKDLFNKLLVNREVQLEKEKQEYLHKVLEYRECKNLVALLAYESEILNRLAKDEDKILGQINEVIESQTSQSELAVFIQRYKAYTLKIKEYTVVANEVDEAIEIGKEIILKFDLMFDSLAQSKKLDNWGTFYKQIQERKRVQKSYIDDAEEYALLIKKLLIIFKAEIDDVVNLDLTVTDNRQMVSTFTSKYYDTLILDWVETLGHQHSLTYLGKTATYVESLIKSLNSVRRSLSRELEKVETLRNDLVLRHTDHKY